jgi:hypothetical protein
MAMIVGTKSGLCAAPIKRPKIKRPKPPPNELVCSACAGIVEIKRARFPGRGLDEDGKCHHCAGFFGFDCFRGVTDLTPEDALKRMADLREQQWGIVLKSQRLAEGSGLTIEIGMGDIFKIMRAGADGRYNEREICNRTRTMEIFATHIQVGPCDITLWPHEISPISFLTVMELRKAGEIEESFVAAEDEQGYFKPTIEIPWR